jgi:hypothetical protein
MQVSGESKSSSNGGDHAALTAAAAAAAQAYYLQQLQSNTQPTGSRYVSGQPAHYWPPHHVPAAVAQHNHPS